jgi:hypothetical protein
VANEPIHYKTMICVKSKKLFLLWIQGEKSKDYFLGDINSKTLLVFDSEEELLDKNRNLNISDERVSEIDLDLCSQLVNSISVKKALPPEESDTLLASWNILDDLARSIDVPLMNIQDDKKTMDIVYDKIFSGTQVGAMVDENNEVHPAVFTAKEVRLIKHYFLNSIEAFANNLGI